MAARPINRCQRPWNRGLTIGQEKPLEPKHVWSIRVRLEIARSRRDLAIFNLAIDTKLRACDLVKLRPDDICSGANVRRRATIVQKKTGRPVQLEITEQSKVHRSLATIAPGNRLSMSLPKPTSCEPSHINPPICAAGASMGREHRLGVSLLGTHSMRRTKAAQIYRKTGNLCAVQLLLGHTKLESTVRSLGVEADDALNIAEQIEL
jgi:integrase